MMSEGGVGKDGLIAAARRLLQTLPPAQVTVSLIAREAGVDPALIRYHFGDREHFLLAVVEDILTEVRAGLPTSADPMERLVHGIGSAAILTRKAKPMQQLMVEELAKARSPEIRARIQDLNRAGVARMASIFVQTEGSPFKDVNPLFMHVATIGMAEFFANAQSMIQPLAPPNTDPDELMAQYQDFMLDLVLNGVKKR